MLNNTFNTLWFSQEKLEAKIIDAVNRLDKEIQELRTFTYGEINKLKTRQAVSN